MNRAGKIAELVFMGIYGIQNSLGQLSFLLSGFSVMDY